MFSEVVALRPAFPRIAFLAVSFALCICFASPVSAVLKCSENSACLATETEEAPRGDRWLCAQERATFQAGDSAECVGLVCEQVLATQRRAVCLPEPACVLCASRLRRWDRNRPRLPAAPPPFPGFWLPSLPRVLRYSMLLRHCPQSTLQMLLYHEFIHLYFLSYSFSGVSEKGKFRCGFTSWTLCCHGDSLLMRPLGCVYRGQSVLMVSFLRRWGWGARRKQRATPPRGPPRPELRALSQPPFPVTFKAEGASCTAGEGSWSLLLCRRGEEKGHGAS